MATTELTRDGSKKVKEVCQEIMTREDEALAYRLQDEEFQTHYIRNRQERSTARIDVKTAKHAYLEEVKEAGLLRKAELQRLAEDDAWLANELQQRLNEEENLELQERAASEMQDEAYAQFLQEREKERVKRERQRRLQKRMERERQELERIEHEKHEVERSERERTVESRPDDDTSQQYDKSHTDIERKKSQRGEQANINGFIVDISTNADAANQDLRPSKPEPQTVAIAEQSRQQELEDEELARRLQRREDEKLRKLMEERDRKLALRMQRQETEEYRRERAERQSRKARSTHEHEAPEEDIRQPRSDSEREDRNSAKRFPEHTHSDPSMHYYEEPVLHRRVSGKTSVNNSEQWHNEGDTSFITRSKSNSLTARPKPDLPEDETIDPYSASKKNIASHSGRNEKVERSRLQTSGGDTPQKSPANDSSQRVNRQHFTNVAASIDPTFTGEVEPPPVDEDKIWAIGDSGIKVSSASKPAPLIQNTKRKQSKGTKDKDKCKQQ